MQYCSWGNIRKRCCCFGFLFSNVGECIMELLISGYCATRCPHSGFFQSVDVVYTNKNSTLQVIYYVVDLKTFKDSFYSSEKHFLFDNCGFWVCQIKVFLRNLAIVSDGN